MYKKKKEKKSEYQSVQSEPERRRLVSPGRDHVLLLGSGVY